MRRIATMPWIATLSLMALLALAPSAARAQACNVGQIDPVAFPGTGPAPGSTLAPAPDGFITFTWCNAAADYFVVVETVLGAHDIFFAFTGGAGGGAGQNFLSLPVCSPTQNLHCIPALGGPVFFTLDTVKNKTILGSFLYDYTEPGAPQVQPVPTVLAVDPKSVTESAAAQTVTLTATASAASTVNQGTVTFQVVDAAANPVGAAVTSAPLAAGSASVSYLLPGGTPAGSYAIRATYSGGTNFLASSGSGTLTVNAAPPVQAATGTTVDPQTVTFAAAVQNVTLTAVVSAASPVNQGTVTFQVQDGAVNVGAAVTSATLAGGNASVIYALPAGLAVGSYTIQASYSGGTGFLASSGSGTLTVSPAPPPNQAVTVTVVNKATATFSADVQHVTLEAGVSTPTGAVNEGTVTFQVMDVLTNVGTAVPSATLTNGLASVSYALPAGLAAKDYAIQASYSGGVDFLPSSQAGILTIGKAASATAFTTTAPPSLPFGGTYHAAATTTGDGTLTLAASGVCSMGGGGLVTMTAGSGTCMVTASESEGPNFFASSAAPQFIAAAKAASTTAFTTSAPPTLQLGGTYTPAATSTGDGTLTIGASGACSIAGGVVTITATAGTCTVTAAESEGPNFLGSSAAPQVIAVATAVTIRTLEAHVEGLNLDKGNKNSLLAKLRAAESSLNRGNGRAAIHVLWAFTHEVRALERSHRLDAKTADSLIGEALQVIHDVKPHLFERRLDHDRD